MIDRLPEDTQTLHAEMLTRLVAYEAERSWSHLAGSFVDKRVHGGDYVYFQYSDPGGSKRQFALGRRSAALDAGSEMADNDGARRCPVTHLAVPAR